METDAPTADHASLAPANYPEQARETHSQGTCVVKVAVDADGEPTGVDRADCNDVFFEAAADAAMRSRFSSGDPRTFTVEYPFSLDSGISHDWRVSVLGSGYGLCAHCADGGLVNEDSVLLGFGRVSDSFLASAYAGWRDGGLEVGAGVTATVFWQSPFSPVAGLRSALVFGEGDIPTYHSFVADGGLVLHPRGQRWAIEVHGGADLRLGRRYYRAMRPDLGVAVSWDFPPPGTTTRLRARNTPTVTAVVGPTAPAPAPVVAVAQDPKEVQLSDVTLMQAPPPVFPPEAAALGLEGSCSVRVSITAAGVADHVEPADCPGVFYAASAKAAMQASFAPYIGPVSGTPTPVTFAVTFDYKGGQGALHAVANRAADIAPALEPHAAQLLGCLDGARFLNPALTGQVTLGWRVVSGVVVDVHVVDDTTGSKPLVECLATGVRALRFAPALTADVPAYSWVVP